MSVFLFLLISVVCSFRSGLRHPYTRSTSRLAWTSRQRTPLHRLSVKLLYRVECHDICVLTNVCKSSEPYLNVTVPGMFFNVSYWCQLTYNVLDVKASRPKTAEEFQVSRTLGP